MYVMNFKKITAATLSVALAFSFAACGKSGDELADSSTNKNSAQIADSSGQKFESPLKPSAKDNRIEPDMAEVSYPEASEKTVYSKTVEECIERLSAFANPNGNKYDAAALLGAFRYPGEDEAALLERFKKASDEWHKYIKDNVGDKCTVSMHISEKNTLAPEDVKVVDWKAVNKQNCEEYANVKCIIETNYSSDDIKISIDLVKVDGSWYLASTGTLNKVRNVIADEIFR